MIFSNPDVHVISVEFFCRYVLRSSHYGRKYTENRRVGQYPPINFHVEGDVPTNNFCTDSYANEWLTTLSLTVFKQRNFKLILLGVTAEELW